MPPLLSDKPARNEDDCRFDKDDKIAYSLVSGWTHLEGFSELLIGTTMQEPARALLLGGLSGSLRNTFMDNPVTSRD